MSGSVIHSQSAARVPAVYSAGQSPQLPVVIDYPAALALRQMSMVHDELPKYLLAPEVSALLHYVPDLRRKMLLATLKQRNEKAARTAGNACRTADSPAGSALRLLVRQSAADDGGNTENSSGTA